MSPATIDRLDYSKPPRFYLERSSDPQEEAALFADAAYEACYLGMTRGESLLAAWAHYKAHSDPPGLTEIFRCGGLIDGEVIRGWKFRFGIASDEVLCPDREAARAAAWAWYDRRLALAAQLDHVEAPEEARSVDEGASHMLTWSDEQVSAVERWLANSTAEMPEVLRG